MGRPQVEIEHPRYDLRYPFDPRRDTMAVRIVKARTLEHEVYVPLALRNNQDYWSTVTRQYFDQYKLLARNAQEDFPDASPLVIYNFASRTAIEAAVNSGQVIERGRKEASIDLMTGAWKEHVARNYLDNLILSPRTNTTIGLLLVDIDHFKTVNDKKGHAAGDEVLAHVVEVIQDNTRATEMIGRMGGEEFAVIFPALPGENDEGTLEHRAEQIRDAVERQTEVTISIGATTVLEDDLDHQDPFVRADRLLYIAKNNGRNTIYAYKGDAENGDKIVTNAKTGITYTFNIVTNCLTPITPQSP